MRRSRLRSCREYRTARADSSKTLQTFVSFRHDRLVPVIHVFQKHSEVDGRASPAMTLSASLRRWCDRDQDRTHAVGAIDDLAVLVRTDEAGIVLFQHRFLAVDNHRQLAFEHEINLLGRRGIGAGAASRQEMRYADDQALGAAGLGAEQPQAGEVAVMRRFVSLCRVKTPDLHQNFSPFSMRYAPFGSVMATRRMMQPSPRSQFHGKN